MPDAATAESGVNEMHDIDYNDKYFVGVENYDSGDLTAETVFHYRQNGEVVWGTFEGGGAVHGNLVAKVLEGGRLEMVWQYLNRDGKFIGGTCISTPEILPDGRIRLKESWQIAGGGEMGKSVIEEVRRQGAGRDIKKD